MKAAIMGTDAYHETMRIVALNSLARPAIYILPADYQMVQLRPVEPKFAMYADTIMQGLTGDGTIQHCTPQASYLFLAWLLIGSDNSYSCIRYSEEYSFLFKVVKQLLVLATGFTPDTLGLIMLVNTKLSTVNKSTEDYLVLPISVVLKAVYQQNFEKIEKVAVNIISFIIRKMVGTSDSNTDTAYKSANNYLIGKAKAWSAIDDKQILSIARNLLFDLLTAQTASVKP